MPATKATKAEIQSANLRFFEMLQDNSMQKSAADLMNDFTRTTIREDSFAEQIMPTEKISYSETDRQYFTAKPIKVVDKEPGNPPAITVPLGATPISRWIRGPRYVVAFDRILSPKFTA